ncbi:unnamed protein product [Allacma fusca]|uniref:3'-5' exonuclease domain-containing protein n=1 Tax=Allacma fusca TaxID=39272 RepID=A0A8J2JL88_9HEXA|nr:unnamed protein product [Allacma fusca]
MDTEGHNNDSKYGYIAVLQIGTWEYGDFILGAYEFHDDIVEFLKPILEDPNVLKVIHGGMNDVLWLQRDFGIFLRRPLDTQIMHEVLTGESKNSFKNLVRRYKPNLVNLLKEETLSD